MADPAPAILVVEDNPITRKMLRVTLEIEQFRVLEAEDGKSALAQVEAGHPALMIQDFVLPDMTGSELVSRIRKAPGGRDLPVILLTGLVSQLEEFKGSEQFSAVLGKPVEPARLLEVVRGFLSVREPRSGKRHCDVLIVDDDPTNRKLMQAQLRHAGHQVRAAASVEEALVEARRARPDVILGDVLMPGLDGFQLCLAAQRDPKLADVPIVLVSSAFDAESDRNFAHDVGASDLVPRTPGLSEAMDAIERALQPRAAGARVATPALGPEYLESLRRQVDRQLAQNKALAERAAIQAAALAVIGGLAQALSRPRELASVLGDVLVHCLDAAGLSTGLLYVRGADSRLQLNSEAGLSPSVRSAAEGAFRHPELLEATQDGTPITLSATGDDRASREFLSGLGHRSALVVPFVVLGRHYGSLVLASDSHDFSDTAWWSFGRALAAQFGQAIALGHTMSDLAESASRLRALMDNANDGISVISPEGVLLDVNGRMLEVLGRSRDEVVGRSIEEFVASDAVIMRLDEFRAVVAHGSGTALDVPIRRSDGTDVRVDFSLRVIEIGSERVVLSIGRDVTQQRSLEQQLRQAQKMEAIGRLAGGVAHDFNNVLTAIFGYADLVLEDLPQAGSARQDVEEIRKAAQRASALTRQLLAFSRQQVLQPTVLSLNDLVEDIDKMLRRLIGEDVELRLSLARDLGNVRADHGQLEQVLMNLVVNARDAMPTGGKVLIETGNVDLTEQYAELHQPVVPGQYVLLAVSDTGMGMDPEIKVRIFEPFFTTKEKGKGTGLGLSTVYGIVKQSGGYIWVYSEPRRGTTFKIYLPSVDAPAERVAAPREAGTLEGTETILVAEDDEMLRPLAKGLLAKLGYHVLEAGDADEALALARRYDGPIHLLVADVVMPGASGRELARRLAESRPDTKVLYVSGYTDDAIVHHGMLEPGLNFLQKPFTPAALARKLREVLDAPPE